MQVRLYNLKPGNRAQNHWFLNKFNTILAWLSRRYSTTLTGSASSYSDIPNSPWALHWRSLDVIPGGNVYHRANMHCVKWRNRERISLQWLAESRKKGAAWVSWQGLVFCYRLSTSHMRTTSFLISKSSTFGRYWCRQGSSYGSKKTQ